MNYKEYIFKLFGKIPLFSFKIVDGFEAKKVKSVKVSDEDLEKQKKMAEESMKEQQMELLRVTNPVAYQEILYKGFIEEVNNGEIGGV